MEPGHEDREYATALLAAGIWYAASMEPGHEDREYSATPSFLPSEPSPQWSPVMKTGNTTSPRNISDLSSAPQWSPVMKTGNTTHRKLTGSRSR